MLLPVTTEASAAKKRWWTYWLFQYCY